VEVGHFGLVPSFAKELAFGRRTYNARSKTVATLASFKHAWAAGQRCIVPAEAIYEPCYESEKAVTHCITKPRDVPMGIADIYRRWRGHDGADRERRGARGVPAHAQAGRGEAHGGDLGLGRVRPLAAVHAGGGRHLLYTVAGAADRRACRASAAREDARPEATQPADDPQGDFLGGA
jgi:hypothetical protein